MIAIRKNQASRCRVYEPSPKDIRRACDEIQARWSPRQRAKRARGPLATWWTVPMIRVSDIVEAINGERADCMPFRSQAGCEVSDSSTNNVVFLDGFPAQKIHCSVKGAEALEAAVFNWARKRGVDLAGLGIDILATAQEDGRMVCKCFSPDRTVSAAEDSGTEPAYHPGRTYPVITWKGKRCCIR